MINRRAAIEELNLQKKRRGNAVWRTWFATENARIPTKSRLQRRAADLRQIQQDYDDAVFKLNNTKKEDTVPPANLAPLRKEVGVPQNKIQSASNTPSPSTASVSFLNTRRNVDGIQNKRDTQNEPPLVSLAREQNRSSEIREAAMQNSDVDEENEMGDFESFPTSRTREQAEAIRDEFRGADIPLAEVTESTNDKDLITELKELKKSSSLNFPIIILFVAFLKDFSDIFSAFLGSIPVLGIIVWIAAGGFSLLCSGIIWFWMLGKGSKAQRKIIINFVQKRLPLILAGLSAELIPYVSLIPTTTLTVFFIAQTSTTLARTIHKAVEKAEDLKK